MAQKRATRQLNDQQRRLALQAELMGMGSRELMQIARHFARRDLDRDLNEWMAEVQRDITWESITHPRYPTRECWRLRKTINGDKIEAVYLKIGPLYRDRRASNIYGARWSVSQVIKNGQHLTSKNKRITLNRYNPDLRTRHCPDNNIDLAYAIVHFRNRVR